MVTSASSSSPRALRYELLTLGDELLLGLTANGHLTFIGAQLGRRGVLLQRNVTITDEADAIAAQFRESWAQADVIITTGGLGPTCDDRTREVLAQALGQQLILDEATEQAIAQECAVLLGDNFVCFGHDTLTKVVADQLRAAGRTLAVAESCTGGLLSNNFTDICGASKFFHGGIVSYSNDAKMLLLDCPECLLSQHGAVSAECAVAMATGVAEKLSADYGVAVTGFAGPAGGTGENPVGTIYLGLHGPNGSWSRKLNYPGPRGAVKQRAVTAAIDWLRRELAREACQAPAPLAN